MNLRYLHLSNKDIFTLDLGNMVDIIQVIGVTQKNCTQNSLQAGSININAFLVLPNSLRGAGGGGGGGGGGASYGSSSSFCL